MDKLEAVARAICYGANCGAGMGPCRCRSAATCRHWRDQRRTAQDAIDADQAWDSQQRLQAHEHMVSNPAWSVEMFGRDREDDVDEAQR
jgi:hypothetical protein